MGESIVYSINGHDGTTALIPRDTPISASQSGYLAVLDTMYPQWQDVNRPLSLGDAFRVNRHLWLAVMPWNGYGAGMELRNLAHEGLDRRSADRALVLTKRGCLPGLRWLAGLLGVDEFDVVGMGDWSNANEHIHVEHVAAFQGAWQNLPDDAVVVVRMFWD